MQSVTVYYVRPGESHAGRAREFSHRAVDDSLTVRGVEQARHLVAFFADSPPLSRPVYCSPLRRAVQTAEIVAAELDLDVRVVEPFRELDVGDLAGRGDDDAWARYQAVLDAWAAGRRDTAFPGGEDHDRLVSRVRRGLAGVVRARGGDGGHPDPVMVVAHGAIMRAALASLVPGASRPAADMENCSITELALRLDGDELTGSLVCWSQQPELAALRPGTGRRRATAPR